MGRSGANNSNQVEAFFLNLWNRIMDYGWIRPLIFGCSTISSLTASMMTFKNGQSIGMLMLCVLKAKKIGLRAICS